MTKEREKWSGIQLVTTVRRNRGWTDTVTPGFVFMNFANDSTESPGTEVITQHGAGSAGSTTDIPALLSLGATPYNPDKSPFDRMLCVFAWEISGGVDPTFRHTLPGAASTAFTLPDSAPFSIVLPTNLATTFESTGSGAELVALDSVATNGWIHIEAVLPGTLEEAASLFAWGMLYRDDRDPF